MLILPLQAVSLLLLPWQSVDAQLSFIFSVCESIVSTVSADTQLQFFFAVCKFVIPPCLFIDAHSLAPDCKFVPSLLVF